MSCNWLDLKGQVGERLPDAHGCLVMACHYPREGAEPQPQGSDGPSQPLKAGLLYPLVC